MLSLGVPYKIAEGIEVIPTPGHTADDVSVVVSARGLGTVVIAGNNTVWNSVLCKNSTPGKKG